MLRWDFTKRIGYCDVEDLKGKKSRFNLYEGNAFMIMLWENDEKYELITFWADEQHAKNCLGLSKGYDNVYTTWKEMTFWLDGNYEVVYKIAKILKKANIHFTIDF